MDVSVGLQQLGLSEYEARAYMALLAAPGANGYEVAKRSGVPRAKIYEVLGGLVTKGAAHVGNEGGERTVYYPTPHEALLARHLARATETVNALGPALSDLAAPLDESPLLTVRGYTALLEQAERIISAAENQLLVSGQPTEMDRLAGALRAAEARGADVYALVYGKADLGLRRQFSHSTVSTTGRISTAVPVLIVIGDHSEALLAEAAASDRATGLLTRQRGVVLIAAEYVKHDVFLCEAVRRFGDQINDRMDDLQAMWFTGPASQVNAKNGGTVR
ncbi:MAG: TrmB family transcriptional regulator [Chloroflexota bacterium]